MTWLACHWVMKALNSRLLNWDPWSQPTAGRPPASLPPTMLSNDAGPCIGVRFAGFLDDGFGIDLPHGRADIPCQDGAGTAVEDTTQEVEGAAYIEIGKNRYASARAGTGAG